MPTDLGPHGGGTVAEDVVLLANPRNRVGKRMAVSHGTPVVGPHFQVGHT